MQWRIKEPVDLLMPTNYTDQFFSIDPFDPPPSGSVLNFTLRTMTDQDNDGDVGTSGNDKIDGSDIVGTYNGDKLKLRLPDGSVQTITGVTFYLANGQKVFTPKDGSVLQNGSKLISASWVKQDTFMEVGDLGPPCFLRGTRIRTRTGLRAIETLGEGERVWTKGGGWQRILWVGHRAAAGQRDNAPVRVAAGALGNRADVRVSPQHRVLLTGWRAELHFGESEILVAAHHLVGTDDRIHRDPRPVAEYYHLLLDGHFILDAEGLLSESFDPGGDFARQDPVVQAELAGRFPHLFADRSETVRPVVRGGCAAVLA
ncbi:hypothetical protein GCM10017056_35180 [Seohaeicola zhoushanensis]|uniref:Hedgehog/Intein (Hint) domain-containing protein n=2 Tax=Seohaeicola zhoushanensis TaxID=1569283 RepID=A0A8J3M9P3_9RHOB|nr:hypothetical protein GCM10017056_35180 [Seohaeicola zhoushanensis]